MTIVTVTKNNKISEAFFMLDDGVVSIGFAVVVVRSRQDVIVSGISIPVAPTIATSSF